MPGGRCAGREGRVASVGPGASSKEAAVTARTRLQSENGREMTAMANADDAGALRPTNGESTDPDTCCGSARARLDAAGETRPLAAPADRCSPDPCQHTDRYRLVMPFSLRF